MPAPLCFRVAIPCSFSGARLVHGFYERAFRKMDGMARSGDTATRLASDHAPSRRPTERVAGLVAWRYTPAVRGILFTARHAAKAVSPEYENYILSRHFSSCL